MFHGLHSQLLFQGLERYKLPYFRSYTILRIFDQLIVETSESFSKGYLCLLIHLGCDCIFDVWGRKREGNGFVKLIVFFPISHLLFLSIINPRSKRSLSRLILLER